MSVHIEIQTQPAEVTIRADDTYTLQLWSDYPNQKYWIKNITPFPDEIITEVTTDSQGYASTILIFHNNTAVETIAEIWAQEYWNFLPGFDSNTIVVHILPSTQPPIVCQPPNGVQRYCVDAHTIAVWNQVDCRYDTAPCGSGKLCENGYCVADAGCVPVWRCESPMTGYETDGCGNRRLNTACNPAQPPLPPGTAPSIYTTEIAIVIAGLIAAALILKKEN